MTHTLLSKNVFNLELQSVTFIPTPTLGKAILMMCAGSSSLFFCQKKPTHIHKKNATYVSSMVDNAIF